MSSVTVRPAMASDLDGLVGLLLAGAEQRRSADPQIWVVPADAPARIQVALRHSEKAGPPDVWFVAEAAGRLLGVAHGMIVPVPPIYKVETSPGLLLDDCFVGSKAPPGTAEALLAGVEAALQARGAGSLISSSLASSAWQGVLARAGYEPVTLYMARSGLVVSAPAPEIRPASPADVAAIVRLSADHRRTLQALNSRFWHIHPDADQRFSQWMSVSLTLRDRDMLVAGPGERLEGYAIAQPGSALLIPTGHDPATIGVVDDFYARDFADVSRLHGGSAGRDLLSAAESAFARRSVHTALVVCPAAWGSKVALLKAAGYGSAKLWSLKRA